MSDERVVTESDSEIDGNDLHDLNDMKHYKFKNWSSALSQAWILIGKEEIRTAELCDVFLDYKFLIGWRLAFDTEVV